MVSNRKNISISFYPRDKINSAGENGGQAGFHGGGARPLETPWTTPVCTMVRDVVCTVDRDSFQQRRHTQALQ